MISLLLLPAAASVFLHTASPTPVADVYVDTSAANCAAGNGTAGSPVCSIASAIALAAAGDTIRIAPGTYVENVFVNIDLELIGTGGASVTTIDGGAAGSVVSISSAITVTIDGLTITNGSAATGGGIVLAGSLSLMNSTVTGNTATAGDGGGISSGVASASLSISNSTLTGNSAFMGSGGAINFYGGAFTIKNSVLSGNYAQYYGGAIGSGGTDPQSDIMEIRDTTISNNTAMIAFGGGVSRGGGRVILESSTLSGNSAGRGGGGMDLIEVDRISISNCTVSGNNAAYGGGISFLAGDNERSITHSTITGNAALSTSGGMSAGSPGLTVRNCIVAGNSTNGSFTSPTSDVGGGLFGSGAFTSLGNNLIGIGGAGFVNGSMADQTGTPASPLDPLLGPLQPNGGATATHGLLVGSPAINTASPTFFDLGDQRGLGRPAGPQADIGAFEANSEGLCNGDGGDGMGCTSCPCGNDAPAGTVGGCLNSTGQSGRMIVRGPRSLSTTGLRFEVEGLPGDSAAILFSGSALAPANASNPCFGLGSGVTFSALDGLRCAVQNIQRHGVRLANSTGQVGVSTDAWAVPPGFFGFFAFVPGQTRYFQVTYRDDVNSICMSGLNTTQSHVVTFIP